MPLNNLMKKNFTVVFYLAAACAAVFLLASCSSGAGGGDNNSDADEPSGESEIVELNETERLFRFAVISDTHLGLTDANENNVRFVKASAALAALRPKIDFAVDTGDVVEDLLCFPGVNCSDPLPVLSKLKETIDKNFNVFPIYLVLGNHDNRYFDNFGGNEAPLASWKSVFDGSVNLPAPYYSFKRGAFTFIMMFSMDLSFDHASNDEPSFGAPQLAWLEERLKDGSYAILFWHHFVAPPEINEAAKPILDVLLAHKSQIKAVFTGHGHEFKKVEWEGMPFYETANMGKRDDDILPHHLVECDGETGAVRIVNDSEIIYN